MDGDIQGQEEEFMIFADVFAWSTFRKKFKAIFYLIFFGGYHTLLVKVVYQNLQIGWFN